MIVTIRRQVVKRCPYVDETDTGTLAIEFTGHAPELHALATQTDKLAAQPISHEDFTEAVNGLVPASAEVVTNWRTGPWDVECRCPGEPDAVLRDPVNQTGS